MPVPVTLMYPSLGENVLLKRLAREEPQLHPPSTEHLILSKDDMALRIDRDRSAYERETEQDGFRGT